MALGVDAIGIQERLAYTLILRMSMTALLLRPRRFTLSACAIVLCNYVIDRLDGAVQDGEFHCAFLAPKLVEAIVLGHQPAMLTAARLKMADLPTEWVRQAELHLAS